MQLLTCCPLRLALLRDGPVVLLR